MGKKKVLRLILPIIALMLIACASAGVTAAYLSRSPGNVKNTITTGSIEIALKEDNWRPEDAENLHANESVAKSPTITNTGKNDAYVFVEVQIPKANVSTIGVNKLKTERTLRELFTFKANTGTWQLIQSGSDNNYAKYVYGYKKILKPGETTTSVFDEVKAINYVESEADSNTVFTVEVIGKAIQKEVVDQNSPVPVSDPISKAYETFLTQTKADAAGGGN